MVAPKELHNAQKVMSENGVGKFDTAETRLIPVDTVEVDAEDAQKLRNLLDALDEVQDVQSVYHNSNI